VLEEYAGVASKDNFVRMCETSIKAHQDDLELADDVHVHRAQCIKKIEQILYHVRLQNLTHTGVALVDENSSVSAILLMEWLSRNQTEYFMSVGCDIVSCVCVLQNVRRFVADTPEESKTQYRDSILLLYKTMAKCVFDAPSEYSSDMIRCNNAFVQTIVRDEYKHIDFSLFVEFYYPDQPAVKQKLTNFLFLYMKENTALRQFCMYENFVEIAIRESEDIETRHDIFFDYTCLMSGERPATPDPSV